MTDTEKLVVIISKSGLKLSFIAEKMGITVFSLSKKIHNKSEFKTSEVSKLCELLKIDSLEMRDEIFFAVNVD